MSESEMRACLEKLESFCDEIDALADFIGHRRVLSGPVKEYARELLIRLKT